MQNFVKIFVSPMHENVNLEASLFNVFLGKKNFKQKCKWWL